MEEWFKECQSEILKNCQNDHPLHRGIGRKKSLVRYVLGGHGRWILTIFWSILLEHCCCNKSLGAKFSFDYRNHFLWNKVWEDFKISMTSELLHRQGKSGSARILWEFPEQQCAQTMSFYHIYKKYIHIVNFSENFFFHFFAKMSNFGPGLSLLMKSWGKV